MYEVRSRPEFLSRFGVVVEEADETLFWLELLVESGLIHRERLCAIIAETEALLAVFGSAQLTVKKSLAAETRKA